jgi:hypothetical protein
MKNDPPTADDTWELQSKVQILRHVDPLVGNDGEISNYTTATAK